MSDTQLVHELSIPELNEMPKEKRLELVRKLESKHAKFSCSVCTKSKISAVHFILGDQLLVAKLLCGNCFNSQMVSVKKKGFLRASEKRSINFQTKTFNQKEILKERISQMGRKVAWARPESLCGPNPRSFTFRK